MPPAATAKRAHPALRLASLRRTFGLLIVGAGVGLLTMEGAERLLAGDARLVGALGGGVLAAIATALGTLPVLLARQLSERTHGVLLGFGAGVMLAASSFSLLIPALRAAAEQGHGRWAASALVAAAVLAGALFLLAAGRYRSGAPDEVGLRPALRRAWLFVFAIALHNLPEGLAIGVAFGGGNLVQAQALAIGISIQDVPEGLVVALALRGVGYGRALSALLGAASGLVEPLGAVVGAAAVTVSAGLLPVGLAFAAGAMLYAISREVIPGFGRHGGGDWATGALMVGFVTMMTLDTALG